MNYLEKIESLSDEESEELKKYAKKNSDWNIPNEWWNGKYYKLTDNNDGDVLHETLDGKKEIPNRRDVFVISKGRFSLKDEPVAYFASELSVAIIETTDEFRDNDELSYKEHLSRYFQGIDNPTPDKYGYPLRFMLDEKAIVLDLSHPDRLFFKLLGGLALYTKVTSREKSCYPICNKISALAYQYGFDGIAYRSARTLVDASTDYTCLVLFNNVIKPMCDA